MKIAVLYQLKEPPAIGGIRKPMKLGGYSDSGADIGYCLKSNGVCVITPVDNPDVNTDTDWVFPDTAEGIERAIARGADTLWCNTVLYDSHPITRFEGRGGLYLIGHSAHDTHIYDDKYYTNSVLRKHGLPVVNEQIISRDTEYSGSFPCILKPIRGRGSSGVVKCNSRAEFDKYKKSELDAKIYGTELMAEEFLCGTEITITVFPNGDVLPPVERYNHINGVAPYNGDVPVTENSRVMKDGGAELDAIGGACRDAVRLLNLKGWTRIDCRRGADGEYKIFDFNLKPNMTGNVRPGRENQNSLIMIAAESIGMTYFDLLKKMTEYRRKA